MDLFDIGEIMKQAAVWMEGVNNNNFMLQMYLNDPSREPAAVARVNSGWWSSWGRCAAGILGGSLIRGLEGGIGAAAVGSLIPGVGTVSAGVAGAIIGVVGGGIEGAADHCD